MEADRGEFGGKMLGVTIIIGLAVLVVLLAGLFAWVGAEGYFFPYPAIDTRFSADYSEVGFRQVEVGMSQKEVLALVGTPLNGITHPTWAYSQDNAFLFWDFAWLRRELVFDDKGRVSLIVSAVAYD